MVLFHQGEHRIEVADVFLHERVVGLVLDVVQVSQVAGVGQLVEVDDVVVGVLVDEQADYMAADETGTAGDYDVSLEFHICMFIATLYFRIHIKLLFQYAHVLQTNF